jgi:hydroxymethylbilane synthase
MIRVGSRESRLAVVQSKQIMNLIKAHYPNEDTMLVTMKTTGDKILDRTLDKIGGKGLFVKELDAALLSGRADITVHSLKDMPMEISEDLPIIAYSRRANPYDALVLPNGCDSIDFTKPIGCSSLRRQIQLKELFPNTELKPIRGNVLTRLEKLDSGEYSALVLASAGLERLGLHDRISRLFTAEEILPAAGQAIIAVQCKAGNGYEYLSAIGDKQAEICATAERACIKRLNGGCTSPAAAFCVIEGDSLYIRGMNVIDGRLIKAELRADISEPEKAGIALAERLI